MSFDNACWTEINLFSMLACAEALGQYAFLMQTRFGWQPEISG